MLESASPSILQSSIDLGTEGFAVAALSVGGKQVFDNGPEGGSSLVSEVVSFEVLSSCERGTLLKTESQIGYDAIDAKRLDYSIKIAGKTVGVSVTRALGGSRWQHSAVRHRRSHHSAGPLCQDHQVRRREGLCVRLPTH
jgi:hypothetical protein